MLNKNRLRKKYAQKRKLKYFEISSNFFKPLIKIIKKNSSKNYINLASYYPSFFEVNTLKLFEIKTLNKLRTLFPTVEKNNSMSFYEWKKNDVLKINKFGMLEPALFSKKITPDIMLVPLLAFDGSKNRLGYGGGFYDRYLNKFLKMNKKILTIGIAFSFQKHQKLPASSDDVCLNYILTEKGII